MIRISGGGRRKDQRGAALVESAIILVPLCLILFGIIEFGFVFKDSLTLSSATRAGARVASAMPDAADGASNSRPAGTFYGESSKAVEVAATAADFSSGDEMWIYKANADGQPTDKACNTDCVRYKYNNGTWNYSGGSTWTRPDREACLGSEIDTVGVKLNLTYHSLTGFFDFLDNLKLKEHTAMRLEPLERCSS